MFMNRSALSHMQDRGVRPRHHYIAMLFGVPLVVTLMMGSFSFAEDPALRSEEQVVEHAKAVWESGAINPALEIAAAASPSRIAMASQPGSWVRLRSRRNR